MESVKTKFCSVISSKIRDFSLVFLKTIPVSIDEMITQKYISIPSFMLPLSPRPIPEMTNAKEGDDAIAQSLSHSFKVILFSLYNLAAHFAPSGKPHSTPIIYALNPEEETPSSFSKIRLKKLSFGSKKQRSKSERMKKGKIAGIIVCAESFNPFINPSFADSL